MDLFAEEITSSNQTQSPLADRLRPLQLDEVVGQDHILAAGAPLRTAIEIGQPPSMILWGPPGSGKTTLAMVVAAYTDARMVSLSAVTGGLADVRRIIATAEQAKSRGIHTILFVDEIHRFNKAQQDAFLPHVESGTITLIGATTENPSFEVIGALLSRTRVIVLKSLQFHDLEDILDRALADTTRGLQTSNVTLDEDARRILIEASNGDARQLLNTLELAVQIADSSDEKWDKALNGKLIANVLGGRTHRYDKRGEEHYNLISALHKSMRASDANASVYWLYRMLAAGEEPLYIARRLIRFASEDVGLGDSQALGITLAARDAYRTLGSPEGELALAQAVLYLACAKKDVRVYKASRDVQQFIEEQPDLQVPMHLRNAPTAMMKEMGYGKDYRYPPTDPLGAKRQSYLPDEFAGRVWFSHEETGDHS